MSTRQSKAHQTERRAALMAELFLQELKAEFVAESSSDGFAFDFLVGFKNKEGGVNTYAIEVTSTEKPIRDTYQVPRHLFNRLAHSNIPLLLLVVDVKQNIIYYAWPSSDTDVKPEVSTVSISLTQVDEDSLKALRQRMAG